MWDSVEALLWRDNEGQWHVKVVKIFDSLKIVSNSQTATAEPQCDSYPHVGVVGLLSWAMTTLHAQETS